MSIFSIFEAGSGGSDLTGIMESDQGGGFFSEIGDLFSGGGSDIFGGLDNSSQSSAGLLPELSITESGNDSGSGLFNLSSFFGSGEGTRGLDLGSILGSIGGTGGLDLNSLFGGPGCSMGLGLGSILGQGGGFDLSSITRGIPGINIFVCGSGLESSAGALGAGSMDLGNLVGGSGVGGMMDNLPIAQNTDTANIAASYTSKSDLNFSHANMEEEVAPEQPKEDSKWGKTICTIAGGVIGACYGSPTTGAAAGSLVGGWIDSIF